MADVPVLNNIDWFDDIFDIVTIDDDDRDDDKQEVERMIMEDYYEELNLYSDQEEEEEEPSITIDKVDDSDKNDQEQILSETLSQLSTEGEKRPLSTPTTSQEENSKKKMCLPRAVDVQQKQQTNQITSYLETMDEMFHRTLLNHHGIPPNNLQVLIECKHQIELTQLQLKRWTRYYEVGILQQIWPKEVVKLFTMKKIEEKQYAIYVEKYAHELNQKLEQVQQQMNTYKEDCPYLLDEFIQNYRLLPWKMKSDCHLARFEYEYQDQLLEREFLSLQPTEKQIEMATNLYKTHHEYSRAKKESMELKHRIQCNQPTQQSVTQALSMLLTTTTMQTTVLNANLYQQEMDQDEKKLQEYLNNFMMKLMKEAEQKISQCQLLFQEQEQRQLCQSILTSSLIDILYRRYELCKKQLDSTEQFRLNYYLRHHFGQQSDEFNLAKISFSPTIIVHTSMHLFNRDHLRLLSRGPTYVPPSIPYQMTQQDLEQNYKRLQHDLNVILVKSNVNLVQSIVLQKQIRDLYMEMYSNAIPSSKSIYARAHYEQQLIETIKQDLKRFNLILRRTHDQQNVFYLGDRPSFEKLSQEFMLQTDLFEIDMTIDNENLQATRDYLANKIKSMNQQFKTIFINTTQYKDQLNKITVLIDKVKLPYLYFLPDLSKQPLLAVKPLVVPSKNSATYRLGKFLDQILRSMIHIHRQRHMFYNGSDFLRKFQDHIDRYHRLCSTTKFVTITIDNFYHLVSHDLMLNTLTDFFLNHYHLPFIEKIHFTKIVQLTNLFLRNNRFYYDNKIYRFIKGGPTSSRLIETLANIYLSRMEQFLMDQHSMQNEFYGRYKNQIFFTWNQSLNELEQILKLMTSNYDHLHFHITIEKKLTYLDIYLENHHGSLYSRIHHRPNQQSFTIPYTSNGNSIRKHSHWLRSSLIRAVRYCTTIEDFNQERIYLEMTYLANGYSVQFIEKHMEHFFTYFAGKPFEQLAFDQRLYEKFRHRLFNFMSEQRQHMEKKQESLKKNRRFHLSYIYDNRCPTGQFNERLRQILSENIQLHDLKFENNKLQLDITPNYQYSLNALLARQRPSHPILNQN